MSSNRDFSRATARVLALVAVMCVALASRARAELAVGAAFPISSVETLEGNWPADIAGKIVVVDFWASWCAPCKASFPALSRLQEEFSGRVVIVGVSVDEKRTAYEQFLARLKPSFATVRDGAHQLISRVQVPTMPTSYVLDRHGVVRFVHAGFHDNTPTELRAEISALLEK